MNREIHVHAGWLPRDSPIGVLHVSPGRGREVFAFEYTRAWLEHRDRPLIDPELRLLTGPQFFQDRDRVNFGVFLDSAPDRWGRTLMNRREAIAARKQNRGDGADAAAGASYLDLAEFIQRHSHRPAADLEELWQRIASSVFVSNTDDHLRNHGFLLTARGWELAPAFDLNADPQGAGLSLNITEADNSLNPELLRETAPHFRIPPRRTDALLTHIRKVVAAWLETAVRLEIPRSEQQRMASAFHLATG